MPEADLKSDFTIAEVVKEIQKCIDEDQDIDRELDALLAQRSALEKKIAQVMYPAESHSLKQNMTSLTKIISDTSVTAYSLSSKVRRLDIAQARLENAIERVDKIVNLKTTIDKVNVLVEKKQYAEAADLTFEVLHKEDTKLTNDASYKVIEELERKLVKLVIKECDRAALRAAEAAKSQRVSDKKETKAAQLGIEQNSSQPQAAEMEISPEFKRVFDLCLILPKLGKKHQGLARYCFAARTMLVVGSKTLQIGKLDAKKYPDRLSEMLDAIAYCIQIHSEVLRESFGAGSELRLIQELLEECDTKIHTLVSKFIQANKIAKIMKGIEKHRRQQRQSLKKDDGKGKGGLTEGGYDPKMLDSILKDNLPRTTKVNQLQQELTGYYIVIEEYFMSQDVQTAVSLDDNSDGSQISSMVDDVFYILKKCSACLSHPTKISMLISLYKDQLNSKLETCWEKSGNLTQLLFSNDQKNQNQAEEDMIIALNNIQVSARHILTLKKHLDKHSSEVFSHIPSAVKMASHCLDALKDTSEAFMRIVYHNINRFVSMQVEKVSGPQALGSLLERFGQQSYEVQEREYASSEANDTYIPSLLRALELVHKGMKDKMTEANLELMLHALATSVVKRIEAFAMRKSFTFWGGLKFDKDIRKISGFFNGLCSRPVRTKFSRLMQIGSLLQVDKVEEILDYWTSDAQVWRLSPREVKLVLSLRLEFSKDEISKLKL
ncbi:hypothetical protein AAMO2058_000378900 [Amorphochlora amoebiformis]